MRACRQAIFQKQGLLKLSQKKTERTSRLTRLFNVRRNNKTVRKENLPVKICARCARPFTWRKRWANCWEAVRYCSKACRSQKSQPVAGNDLQNQSIAQLSETSIRGKS